jgi:phosphatidylserine/phosphatidylglycerophosphate/cardiolipin synthase-like enzyme
VDFTLTMFPAAKRTVICFFFIIIILLVGCGKESPTTILLPEYTPGPVNPTAIPPEWYSVYFTDPGNSYAEYHSGGPDDALAKAIDRARLSVDVAVYDLDLYNISNALINAHRRGVIVRVVTESDNLDSVATRIPALQEAGIPVIGDRREGLMHNKFTVIDRAEIWSGSMNYTANDAYHNDNNLIRIRSTQLAEDYTTEFNEMFVQDYFGAGDSFATPHPTVNANGTEIEVYFSPDDGVVEHIVDQIASSQESIFFLAYAFNSDQISQAMRGRVQAGVNLAGVFEKTQVAAQKDGSAYDPLRLAGLDVWLDANPQNMHDKIILIDGKIVITGSYNFSAAAENKNDENILIIHNADIAALYLKNFQDIYNQAKK